MRVPAVLGERGSLGDTAAVNGDTCGYMACEIWGAGTHSPPGDEKCTGGGRGPTMGVSGWGEYFDATPLGGGTRS